MVSTTSSSPNGNPPSPSTTQLWEPLPPRNSGSILSARERHRRFRQQQMMLDPQVTFVPKEEEDNHDYTTTPNDDNETKKKKNPQQENFQRRPNRPGFNSYLKVLLDTPTLDLLHEIAVTIQTDPLFSSEDDKREDNKNPKDNNDDTNDNNPKNTNDIQRNDESILNKNDDNDNDNIRKDENQLELDKTSNSTNNGNSKEVKQQKKGKGQRALRFKPRSRVSLHMTFFFGGEVLCELPADDLKDWHQKISARLKESQFVLSNNNDSTNQEDDDNNNKITNDNGNDNKQTHTNNDNNEIMENDDKDYSFQIKQLCLFPPRRNNLIVAILEASPLFHKLHDDLRNIAMSSSCQELVDVTKYSKEKWTPHITLGNIMNGKFKNKQQQNELNDRLRKLLVSSTTNGLMVETSSQDTSNNRTEDTKHTEEEKSTFQAKASGIAMGGPIPEQIPLDWDFRYTYLPTGKIK